MNGLRHSNTKLRRKWLVGLRKRRTKLLGQKREKLSRTMWLNQHSKKGKIRGTKQKNSAELFPTDGNG